MFKTPPKQFANIEFQLAHVKSIMAFYDGCCFDACGGFFHYFLDDGKVYNRTTRHLVSSTRFVINYAKAARYFGRDDYTTLARHGLDFIESVHLNPSTGGYAWLLDDGKIIDSTNHCYGAAFILLCYAEALKSGVSGALAGVESTYHLLSKKFWRETEGLFVDEYDATFNQLSPYRGQNANMHCCEALICAFQATKDLKFLRHAQTIANSVLTKLAPQGDGLIWEHYDENWRIDWRYHLDDPKHLFQPWGFQPGHQTEWCKLLLTLNLIEPNAVYVSHAKLLFDRAVMHAWDNGNGGLIYGLSPDGSVCDSDKYFWVQAESFAAAALLAEVSVSEEEKTLYWNWVEKIWGYSWTHFVDHQHGAWYRILAVDNRKYSNEKSPAGKTDYHTMGASFELIEVLKRCGK
jgi:mannose/cellobiose epimerase-like protein (N-acyl-D-glucosamine 2-epimerase family)